MIDQVVPEGENLRRALAWLAAEGRHDLAAIDEAARRFDLSALDEEFLLRQRAEGNEAPSGRNGDSLTS